MSSLCTDDFEQYYFITDPFQFYRLCKYNKDNGQFLKAFNRPTCIHVQNYWFEGKKKLDVLLRMVSYCHRLALGRKFVCISKSVHTADELLENKHLRSFKHV